MYVDMTSDPAIGGAVEATFKVAGAYKRTETTVYIVTTNGYKIALHADTNTGTITMDGATFPVLDTPPSTGGRRLETSGAQAAVLETKTARQMAEVHEERRKLFTGALMTSGSFTMMAAGGNVRRKLFAGALMESGSFTMMAAGGVD